MQLIRKGIFFLLLYLGYCSFAISSSITQIRALRINHNNNEFRFVFTANHPVQYHQFQLSNPNRLIIDIHGGVLFTKLRVPSFATNTVKEIRSAVQPNGDLRLVFDLQSLAKIKTFALKSMHGQPNRLVVDFIKKNIPVPINIVEKQKPNRDIIIVIDPGHGGKDPGATGPHGTHEKNVVLAISKKLQAIINNQPGFKAVLTRDRDFYIPLRQRLAIARRYKADMFVAIHADAYRNRTARGASVYALSNRGATGEAARWLAKRENASELMGGVELSDKDHLLKSVLISLSQTATIRASLVIGTQMINFLDRIAYLHHHRVEQAAFVVLKSPDIPSLLVETGFLSNPSEERRLRTNKYQERIALAIMKGIRTYFTTQPPRNTWLAYWRDHPRSGKQQYIVHRGDTLSGIAQRYHVSAEQLIQLNHIRTSYLRRGQVLLIPSS